MIGELKIAAARPDIHVDAKCMQQCPKCDKESEDKKQEDKKDTPLRRSKRLSQYAVPVNLGASWMNVIFYPNMAHFGPTVEDFPVYWAQQESVDSLVSWFWKLARQFEQDVLQGDQVDDSRKYEYKRFGSAILVYDDKEFDARFNDCPFVLQVGPTANWGTYIFKNTTGVKIRHADVAPVDIRDVAQHQKQFYLYTGYEKPKPHKLTSHENKCAIPVYVGAGETTLIFYPDPDFFARNAFTMTREDMIDTWTRLDGDTVELLVSWFWNICGQYNMLNYYTTPQGNGPLVTHEMFGQAFVLNEEEANLDHYSGDGDPWKSGLQLDIGISADNDTFLVQIDRPVEKGGRTQCTRVYHADVELLQDNDENQWSETDSETSELPEDPNDPKNYDADSRYGDDYDESDATDAVE